MASETNNGKEGGLLKGKRHEDKNGKSLGGIKAIVTDTNQIVELEAGEVIINREASKKHWKELSKINQSAGGGVPILPPDSVESDTEEYKNGGRTIDFNPNHIPNKWVYDYAKNIKEKYPKVWELGGNEFGNEAFKNLERVINRGSWTENEEWMYVKWQSFNARHKQDFRIAGVIANLKWLNKVSKGWDYMKSIIQKEIEKQYPKKGWKHKNTDISFKDGGSVKETENGCEIDLIVTQKFKVDGKIQNKEIYSDKSENCFLQLLYSTENKNLFQIAGLFVKNGFRKNGLGSSLIIFSKNRAIELGFDKIVYYIADYDGEEYNNLVSFCKKNGFKFVGSSTKKMVLKISKNKFKTDVEPAKGFNLGGVSIKETGIEYINSHKAVLNNGYYLIIKDSSIYVGDNDEKVPHIKSFCLVAYNSSGQKNLKVADTINAIELSNNLQKLIGGEKSVSQIIISEFIQNAKRLNKSDLAQIANGNIIIADRDNIVCSVSGKKYSTGGKLPDLTQVQSDANSFRPYGIRPDDKPTLDVNNNKIVFAFRDLGNWVNDEQDGQEDYEDNDQRVWARGEYTKYKRLFEAWAETYSWYKYAKLDIQTSEKDWCYFSITIENNATEKPLIPQSKPSTPPALKPVKKAKKVRSAPMFKVGDYFTTKATGDNLFLINSTKDIKVHWNDVVKPSTKGNYALSTFFAMIRKGEVAIVKGVPSEPTTKPNAPTTQLFSVFEKDSLVIYKHREALGQVQKVIKSNGVTTYEIVLTDGTKYYDTTDFGWRVAEDADLQKFFIGRELVYGAGVNDITGLFQLYPKKYTLTSYGGYEFDFSANNLFDLLAGLEVNGFRLNKETTKPSQPVPSLPVEQNYEFILKTPSGVKSKLNYLQQVLVRSKKFKEWFGDWETASKKYIANGRVAFRDDFNGVSKVMDMETLEPRVVYHGTPNKVEFFEFRTEATGLNRPYSYFAYNKEYSQNFLTKRNASSEKRGVMYECFLNVKDPFIADGKAYYQRRESADYWAEQIVGTIAWDRYGAILKTDKGALEVKRVMGSMGNYLQALAGNNAPFWKIMSFDIIGLFKAFLQFYKYDGMIYSEEFQSKYDENNPAEFTRAVCVFEPNQIKLADGRNLTFDGRNPDIRFEEGGEVSHIRQSNHESVRKLIMGDILKDGGEIKADAVTINKGDLHKDHISKTKNQDYVESLINKMK